MSQKNLALAGIVAPIMFVVIVIVLGIIDSDFSFSSDAVGVLGASGADYPLIMNVVGYVVVGLLFIPFALGLHRGINSGDGSRFAPVMLGISGAAWAGMGLFPGNVSNIVTFAHSVMVLLTFGAGSIALLRLAVRFQTDDYWTQYRAPTYAFAFLTIGNTLIPPGGIKQLFMMALYLGWIEGAALLLYRRPAEISARSDTESGETEEVQTGE